MCHICMHRQVFTHSGPQATGFGFLYIIIILIALLLLFILPGQVSHGTYNKLYV